MQCVQHTDIHGHTKHIYVLSKRMDQFDSFRCIVVYRVLSITLMDSFTLSHLNCALSHSTFVLLCAHTVVQNAAKKNGAEFAVCLPRAFAQGMYLFGSNQRQLNYTSHKCYH